MEQLLTSAFISILNMSITGSYVILAVLMIRFLLRRAPKKYAYLLWSVVGFRLCCPVTFESVFSLFSLKPFDMTAAQKTADHALTYIPGNIGMMQTPQITTGIPAANTFISGSMPDGVIHNLSGQPTYSANPMQIWTAVGAYLWLIGIAALMIYAVVSCIVLHCRLRTATRLDTNVWQSETVRSPFILGLIKPKIYIPYRLDEDALTYVLLHERYHIRCLDHVVRPLAFFILTVHWFNPLAWLAFVCMGRDMEMRCDEWVLSQSDGIRKIYSTSLLSFASNRRFPSPTPLAFGETGVKGRIKNVLRWKKPKLWITVTALVLCLAVLIACAANPEKNTVDPDTVELPDPFGCDYRITDTVYAASAFSYVTIPDGNADYRITLDGQLYMLGNDTADADYRGTLTEITLTAENFDDRIDTSVWAGQDGSANSDVWQSYGIYDSPADIRENNARAWTAQTDDSPSWSCFLQQKDGTALICISYTEDITWIYRVEPVPTDGAYHSVQCVYMTPLSSTITGADSGYTYYLTDTYFAMVHNTSGSTTFTMDLADTEGWQPFPYTAAEWSEMFMPLGGADYEYVNDGEWLRLNSTYALLRRGGKLRIYQIHKDVGVWSAYDLEPGSGQISVLDAVSGFIRNYPREVIVSAWVLAPDSLRCDAFVLFTDVELDSEANIGVISGDSITVRSLDHFTRLEVADYNLTYLGNETLMISVYEFDELYDYIITLTDAGEIAYERVKRSPYPETMPEDFDIRFEMWVDVTQKNIFDTYDGYIQKDLIRDGIFGKQFEPTDEMMQEIYAKLVECDMASIDKEITPQGILGGDAPVSSVSPNTSFQVYFTIDGREYLVLGNVSGLGIKNPMTKNCDAFLRYLCELQEQLETAMDFPEADGGYM